MTVKELEEIQLNDLEADWELITGQGDITDVVLGWKLENSTPVELCDMGCLFVRWCAEDIDQVWLCESNIPYHYKEVYQLK